MYRTNRWARAARDADPGGEPTAGGGGAPAGESGGGAPVDPPKDEKQHSAESFAAIKAEKQRAIDERDAFAKKIKDFEDAQLSKEDKLAKDHAEAKTKAEAAELLALKLDVALEEGLTKKQALRLSGATREELIADAKDLRETFSSAADRLKKKPEGLRGSGAPDDEDDASMDPAALAKRVRERTGARYGAS